MFENLFGTVTRFIQRRLAPQARASTPQGQAKLDAFATQKGAPQQKQKQMQMGATPEGQAKLDANVQGKQAQPFGKPMGYGKGIGQK